MGARAPRRAPRLSPRLAVVIAACACCVLASDDCDVAIQRRFLPGTFARAVPVATDDGFAVVTQTGPEIHLARFSKDCKALGERLLYRSEDFWRESAGSGLQDAAALTGGRIAVAWVLGGDVFLATVAGDGQGDVAPVRANNESADFRHRAQVSVATGGSSGDGFAVAWASWLQDGDAWGVFARHFDAAGQPAGLEQQVNVWARGFQWLPQLRWCQGQLWALWANSSTGARPPRGVRCAPRRVLQSSVCDARLLTKRASG